MASPATRPPPPPPPASSPSHPLTPPADPSPPHPHPHHASQQQQPSSTSQTTTAGPPTTNPASTQIEALLSQPLTSTADSGAAKRPRDHRLIHLLLASHGISAYQERVPLQLMDFAYRYTSSVLSDAVHVQAEGYDNPSAFGSQYDHHSNVNASGSNRGRGRGGAGASARGGGAGGAGSGGGTGGGGADEGDVTLSALRMAIASRMSYQFQGSLPKEFLKGLAEERNRIGLGVGLKEHGTVVGGVVLPSEKYCLTGLGWGVKEAWDSEGEEEGAEGADWDVEMAQLDRPDGVQDAEDGEEEDGKGMGTMEDVFGDPASDVDRGGVGEDEEMRDS